VTVLVERSALVWGHEGLYTVQDADFDPAVSITGALEESRQQVYGSNGRIIVAQVVDASVRVRVTVQTFPGPPTEPDKPERADWSAPVLLRLSSRSGSVNIDQPTSGPPPELAGITLPAGPGDYHIAASHQGRDTLSAHLAAAIYPHLASLPVDELSQAFRRLDGTEHHLLQIWPTRHSAP
jgi:hypothetical protein